MVITKKKIIVVDDEKSIRDLVREVLEEEGYEVDTAINGIDGIKKIKELAPDLVIVDIMMPLMNGYHMVNELVNDKDIKKLPEFLILTVRSKKLDNGLGERIGACVYLEKPFRREILVSLVQEILRKSPSCKSGEESKDPPNVLLYKTIHGGLPPDILG